MTERFNFVNLDKSGILYIFIYFFLLTINVQRCAEMQYKQVNSPVRGVSLMNQIMGAYASF